MTAWTNITKPAESSIVVISNDAEPFGLLIAITSVMGATITSVTSGWGKVVKPAASGWTNITKPAGSGWTNIIKPTS